MYIPMSNYTYID